MRSLATMLLLATLPYYFSSVTALAYSDVENGRLIEQSKCASCHAAKSGFGDADMIYKRADHKVTNYSKLKLLISSCNAELRLDLFPEDEADISDFLNSKFYKFKP